MSSRCKSHLLDEEKKVKKEKKKKENEENNDYNENEEKEKKEKKEKKKKEKKEKKKKEKENEEKKVKQKNENEEKEKNDEKNEKENEAKYDIEKKETKEIDSSVDEMLQYLPQDFIDQHIKIIKEQSPKEAIDYIEKEIEKYYSQEEVDNSFWEMKDNELPTDEELNEIETSENIRKKIEVMKLEDELNSLITQINRLTEDKVFSSITNTDATIIAEEYNKYDVDVNFDVESTSGGFRKKTNYVLNAYHVMVISKKLKLSSSNSQTKKNLVKLLDEYHETGVASFEDNSF